MTVLAEDDRDAIAAPEVVEGAVPRRWAIGLAVLASYSILAVVYFIGAWGDPAHRQVGSPGDPSLFVWYLRWIPWAIAHGHNPLFSSYVNAPHGVNLMWNTAVFLPAVLMAPVTALWGPWVTFNVLATAALALSGWTAWLAFRRICGLGWGAWLGGLVFAFSPFLVAQSFGHLHMTSAYLLPLLAIAAHEVLVTQRWSPPAAGLVLGGLAAAQLLTGEELLAISVVALSVGAIALACTHFELVAGRLPYVLRAAPWAVGAFVVLAGAPLAFQFLGPQVVHGAVQPPDHYVTDLWAPLVPARNLWLHPFGALTVARRFQANGAEWCAYLGAPLLVLMATVVAVRRKHRATLAAGLAAVALLILSFGPHLHVDGPRTGIALPWDLLGRLPPLISLLPVRLMVAVELIAAGMVGMAAETAWRLRRGWLGRAALAGVGLAVVPLVPMLRFPAAHIRVPSFFTSPAVKTIPAGSLIVVAPYPEPRNVATLRWQVASGFRYRMAGGYALVPGDLGKPSFTGPDTATRDVLDRIQDGAAINAIDARLLAGLRAEIGAGGASSVIVGPMAHRGEAIVLFTRMLGRPPAEFGDVAVWTGLR